MDWLEFLRDALEHFLRHESSEEGAEWRQVPARSECEPMDDLPHSLGDFFLPQFGEQLHEQVGILQVPRHWGSLLQLLELVQHQVADVDDPHVRHLGEVVELQVGLDLQLLVVGPEGLGKGQVLELEGGLHVLGDAVADVGLVVQGAADFEGLEVDHLDSVEGAVDGLALLAQVLHAFHLVDEDHFSVFEGVLAALQQSHQTPLGNLDVAQDHLSRLLPVPVLNGEVAEVVDQSAEGGAAIGADELDAKLPADLVQGDLLLDGEISD